MRRILATIAATALMLSSVGSAIGAELDAAGSPAPVVEPTPSVDPAQSAEPAAGASSQAPTAPPSSPPSVDPSAEDSPAPVVAATTAPGGQTTRPTDRGAAASVATPDATDPTGRWIVVLKPGTDVVAASDRHGRRIGFASDRMYRHAVRGYAARLDRNQVTALSHDPSVAMIVADEKIWAEAQTLPTGISRMGATRSGVAKINGLDERVDADVAIVDTGIAPVADLNVAGGYNCSSADRAAWRDDEGHGTHVAGTVGAIDNGNGVVGVAPGVRLWAVKILDRDGEGLLSWYVCGLDWIAAQRDPSDPNRPRMEAVNMSVAKWGKDDVNCGNTNKDILHQAICRLVSSGVTVVAAAGNDASSAAARVPAAYNEVITVSALADSDGKAGALGGGRCYSWGTYDRDDTFADFSNYGSDVDLIAPGKCIWSTIPSGYGYSSGTSMAAPHVAGAAAILKADRPGLTPAEVKEALQYLGNLGWSTSTDPDTIHEKLLDASRIGPRGTFAMTAGEEVTLGEAGGVARYTISVSRSATSFERIRFGATNLPAGTTASFDASSLYGFGSGTSTLSVRVPLGLAPGTYAVSVNVTEHGANQTAVVNFRIQGDPPVAQPPATIAEVWAVLGTTTIPTIVSWNAASDPTSPIAGYELQSSTDGGAWMSMTATGATVRRVSAQQALGHSYQYRVRARDTVGNWSSWADGPSSVAGLVQDRAATVVYNGTWVKSLYAYASGGSTTYASAKGARVRLTFGGRAVALVAPVGSTRGSAAVYVDGAYRGTVSFKTPSGKSRVVMFSTAFSSVGTHTIDIRLSGNGRVDIDAFVILR